MNPLPDSRLRDRLAALDASQRRELARQVAGARGGARRVPLSADQHRMWSMEQQQPPEAAHVVAAGTRMVGALDVRALRAAVDDVVARHDALRTRIVVDGDGPVQAVGQDCDVALELIDLADVDADERERALDRVLCAATQRPFQLDGPLTRLPLVRLSDDEHVLGVIQHHIISDWISFGTFLHELLTCYAARVNGRNPALQAAPQYEDWVRHQQRERALGRLDGPLAAVAARLDGVGEPVTLAGHRASDTRAFHGERHWMVLPAPISRGLHELARTSRCSLFMVVLAVLDQLLAEQGPSSDVVVGAPTANRGAAPDDLIGLLLTYLVLRTDVPWHAPMTTVLPRVRETTLGALECAHVPFADVVRRVAPERALAYDALFRVRYLFLRWPPPRYVSGLALSPYDINPRRSLHDVTVSFWDGPLGLFGRFEARTDAYDTSTVRTAMSRFGALLAAAAGAPAPGAAFLTDDAAMTAYFKRLTVM